VVGPIVVLAAGGVEAELLDDVAVAPAPIDVRGAHSMIGELRMLRRIAGFRGRAEGDLQALACAIAAFSRLAQDPTGRLIEAEINPLIVRAAGDGVVAVDALLRFAHTPTDTDTDTHTDANANANANTPTPAPGTPPL
jgi:succinyl-CoA synthetase beta subunit